jgi:hypothetical protein
MERPPLRSPRADVLVFLAEKGSVPVIRSEEHIDNDARAALCRSGRVGMRRSRVDNTYHYVLLASGREEARALGVEPASYSPDFECFGRDAE